MGHLPLKRGGINGEAEHLPLKGEKINEETEHFPPKLGEIKEEIKDLSASQKVKINPSQSLPSLRINGNSPPTQSLPFLRGDVNKVDRGVYIYLSNYTYLSKNNYQR